MFSIQILPSSRLDIPLFLTLVERGHTLLNAPVTLTTSQQMHQALLVFRVRPSINHSSFVQPIPYSEGVVGIISIWISSENAQ